VWGTCRAIKRPVAGGDIFIVDQMDRALENVNRELVDPAIPVAFIELLAIRRMAEEAGPYTHIRT